MAILLFFVLHWFASLFAQSFFLHRYASHSMIKMSPFWERFFFIFTFIVQGSSYLQPRAYAIMHRLHHAHSDTDDDPHSPHAHGSVFAMMWSTFRTYRGLVKGNLRTRESLQKNIPVWPALDRIADPWPTRLLFMALYTALYATFATQWWMWLLLPIHFVMGPAHGAIVNWCGHKYGYVNFPETNDHSRNALPIDVVTCGELFQNNHHKFPSRPNFAVRVFEVDPTYLIMRLMSAARIIQLKSSTRAREAVAARLTDTC